jgi:phytoene/squalene synthetase
MSKTSAGLARSITKASSKQSYFIARFLVDKDLVDDCMRAYAYFRWVDDVIDVSTKTAEERISFINRQKWLVDSLYKKEHPGALTPEERMVADLIAHDRGENSGLQSFIRSFLAALEFDARRKGKLVNQAELTWYSSCLGQAVTDAIQYFIGNNHMYPSTDNQYLAATAAHITHMLRDMIEDIDDGFVNIPREHLEEHGLSLVDVDKSLTRDWVRGQVERARDLFRDGQRYLDQLDSLRCKIAGYWYCARFECVLDAIERDGYMLRPLYHERHKLFLKLKMGWLAISITPRHLARRDRRSSLFSSPDSISEVTVTDYLKT